MAVLGARRRARRHSGNLHSHRALGAIELTTPLYTAAVAGCSVAFAQFWRWTAPLRRWSWEKAWGHHLRQERASGYRSWHQAGQRLSSLWRPRRS